VSLYVVVNRLAVRNVQHRRRDHLMTTHDHKYLRSSKDRAADEPPGRGKRTPVLLGIALLDL
jgi:hypothetical protein